MSLLLQALQKAARNRETGAAADETAAAAPQEPTFELEPEAAPSAEPPPEEQQEELTLAEEDLFEPEMAPEPLPEPEPEPLRPGQRRDRPATPFAGMGGASSAYAATVLRASEARSTSWLDWVRDRPVHAFAAFAAIFLVFYGGYVYLQIFHPAVLRGNFLSKPLTAKSPPPPPSPISKAPSAPQPPSAPEPTASAAVLAPAAAPTPAAPAAAMPSQPQPESKPLTGMPQAQAKAPSAAAPERAARPSIPRPARRAAPRRVVEAPGLAAATMEDTVAVRQPDAPALTSATLMQAWEALQRGRFAEAEALYQKVEQAEPLNVDALLGLAAIAAQRGAGEQAARYYSRALELEPRNPTAQAGLISLIGQADPQLSESRLKQLIAREPSANLYFALGNLYARESLWAEAQQAYFQAYGSQPDNPDYAYNLAVGLEHMSQPKLALTYYRKALELGAQRGHASFDTARVEERIGQLTARIGSE
jgi:tetratricopeptide (TPR) repeat protein